LRMVRRGNETVGLGGDEKLSDGDTLLTFEPLMALGERYLSIPGITSYAEDFQTYFEWTEPDRRGAGRQVTGIDFDVTATDQRKHVSQRPGVINE